MRSFRCGFRADLVSCARVLAMSRYEWGPEGPPEETYSRVTDAERFRPLHQSAFELLVRLEVAFDVERTEGYGLDPELEVVDLAHPSVRLTPQGDFCAPLTVAFTTFPGLVARFGRWRTDWFPDCGCDACGSDAEEEFSRLNQMVSALVSGGFRESLSIPRLFGAASLETEMWSSRTRHRTHSRVERSKAKQMTSSPTGETIAWMPWPRHGRRSTSSPYAP